MAKKSKAADMTADEVIEALSENENWFWWSVKRNNSKGNGFVVVVGVQSENKREKPSYYEGRGATIGEAYGDANEKYENA